MLADGLDRQNPILDAILCVRPGSAQPPTSTLAGGRKVCWYNIRIIVALKATSQCTLTESKPTVYQGLRTPESIFDAGR